jgi:PAS domain S-box-containing protein
VLDLASKVVIHAGPDHCLIDAARLMAAKRISFLPILDEARRPLGIIAEADLLAALRGALAPDTPLRQVAMPITSVPASMSCDAAYRLCMARNISHLAIVDADGCIVGVVSETDFRIQFNLGTLAGHHLVQSVMAPVLHTLAPHDHLQQAIDLMEAAPNGCLVVTEGERPVGIITVRDTTRLYADEYDPTMPLHAVMGTPLHTITSTVSINQAADLMLTQRIRHLVVVDDNGYLAGLVSEHDLTRTMALGLMDIAIEQDRTRQHAVLAAMPDLVWLKDPDGVYLLCNPRFEQFFGAREADIRGKTDHDFVPAELADSFRDHDRRAMSSDRPSINEELLTFASDGHRELTQTIKTPVRDADGTLLGVLGISRDITALRQTEDEYRHLFAHNPAPMAIYDHASLMLRAINDAFLGLYGYSRAEALTLQLSDLGLPQDRARIEARIRALRGLSDTSEWRSVRRDGTLIYVMAQSHDLDYEGEPCRVIAITDITALKRGQQRDRSRLALLENLAHGAELPALLEQLVLDHEAMFPQSLCSVLLLDASGRHLQVGAAPHLPDMFNQAVQGMVVGQEVGSCGAAIFTAQRVIAADLSTHPNWAPFRELTAAAGLGACWSEPIIGAHGRVLGSFAVYHRAPAEPSDEELEHVAFSVQLASTAISHWNTNQRLRDSERRLQAILRAVPDLVWLQDTHGAVQSCNAAFTRLLGRPATDIIGRQGHDLLDPQAAAALRASDAAVQTTRQPHTSEQWLSQAGDATRHLFETIKTPLFDADGSLTGVLGVARDITERKQHEAHIQRVNQAYALLSGVNEAIVRIRDTEQLYAEVCRITVEVGGFLMAWVGQLNSSGDAVIPIAAAGHNAGYIEHRPVLLQQSVSPMAVALRTGQLVVANDISKASLPPEWLHAATQRGYRAVAVLPIPLAGQPRHFLAVYCNTVDRFDTEQTTLLTRLAQDLGFALELTAAETAAHKEQRLREQLMESVAGLFFAIDLRGQLVLWNHQLENVTGYSPSEIAGRHATDYFDTNDKARIRLTISEVFASGESRVEAVLVTKNGQHIPYLFVSRRVDLAPEPLMVGTGIDISARVRSEQELARYRQHLEELVASRTAELETANLRLSREDQRLRAMLQLSQQASALSEAELFQRSIDEITRLSGSGAGCLHTADSGGLTLQAWAGCTPVTLRAAAGQAPASAEPAPWQLAFERSTAVIIERGDHPAAALGACPPDVQRMICVPIVDEELVRFVICAANKPQPYNDGDVRELELLGIDLWRILRRRRIELALEKAKAAADAANQAKSAFLANMSHEIRTPMNAIVGFAHLLRRDPLSPRQLDHLGKIGDASQHLLQVINDILDFSRIEAHKVQLEEADFDLRSSVERVTAMLLDKARAKQLSLTTRLDGCPTRLRGDRLRLEQILLNLLGNAVKFTPQGHVELRIVPLAQDSEQITLRFEVEDSGIGIAPEQIGHLFEAFEQADVSTTRRFGGTGLGLAISKRLVQLMHGRIGVQSQPGQGSTFWFELPLRRAGAPGAAAESASHRPVSSPSPAAAPLSAAPALSEDQQARVQAVAGLDSVAALARLRGNWPLYLRTLGLFLTHHAQSSALLTDSTLAHDRARLRQAAHALAGAAATIGADALHRQAKALETLALQPDGAQPPTTELAALRADLTRFTSALQAALVPPEPTSAVALVDWQAVLRQLDRMRPLLVAHDTAVGDIFEPARPLLVQALGPLAASLEAALQGFDFEAATVALDRAVQLAHQPR